jgi:hypothetical protein
VFVCFALVLSTPGEASLLTAAARAVTHAETAAVSILPRLMRSLRPAGSMLSTHLIGQRPRMCISSRRKLQSYLPQ